jgi:hypothetical protein
MPVYRHRQSSVIIPASAFVGVVAVVGAAALISPRPAAFAALTLLALVLIALAFGISSLTIEITDDELVWFFGPGIWRKRIARRDIASVTAVRNPWWHGIGIHLTPRGWLYNVGGSDAVEIALVNGRRLRLGTDEPAALVEALSGRP